MLLYMTGNTITNLVYRRFQQKIFKMKKIHKMSDFQFSDAKNPWLYSTIEYSSLSLHRAIKCTFND